MNASGVVVVSVSAGDTARIPSAFGWVAKALTAGVVTYNGRLFLLEFGFLAGVEEPERLDSGLEGYQPGDLASVLVGTVAGGSAANWGVTSLSLNFLDDKFCCLGDGVPK